MSVLSANLSNCPIGSRGLGLDGGMEISPFYDGEYSVCDNSRDINVLIPLKKTLHGFIETEIFVAPAGVEPKKGHQMWGAGDQLAEAEAADGTGFPEIVCIVEAGDYRIVIVGQGVMGGMPDRSVAVEQQVLGGVGAVHRQADRARSDDLTFAPKANISEVVVTANYMSFRDIGKHRCYFIGRRVGPDIVCVVAQ